MKSNLILNFFFLNFFYLNMFIFNINLINMESIIIIDELNIEKIFNEWKINIILLLELFLLK